MDRIRQACVVPIWRHDDQDEVCLITSLRKKRWIFPKGIVDPGETLEETGLKEAWEEAGLRGKIVGDVVGEFLDHKWGAELDVKVMVMEVDDLADEWPESEQRKRRWCSFKEAKRRLHRDVLRGFLKQVEAMRV